MGIDELIYLFSAGALFGALLMGAREYFEKKALLRRARQEGEHILQLARDKSSFLLSRGKREPAIRAKRNAFEKEKERSHTRLQELKAGIDKQAFRLKLKVKEHGGVLAQIQSKKNQNQTVRRARQTQRQALQKELKRHISNKIQQWESRFSFSSTKLKESLKREITEEHKAAIRKKLSNLSRQEKHDLQRNAVFHLNMALNRFEKPYCAERGIGAVAFKTLKSLEKTLGENNIFLNEMEKECGVDILVNKEDLQALVFGMDPVRRELGRMALSRFARRPGGDLKKIKDIVRQTKKELFIKIRQDGKSICKRLELKNINTAVQDMMGALRYRYSFAQNQHFHCEEVGWLCGLLSAELNLTIKTGRRAGMFHDIGKAMDHSIEGNHAVIGADFLSRHNEETQEVLHAVRAHHHDETPQTALAWLVISADAVSGSRPGARRFTEDSYNEKMANLERILNSFDNIEDAYIMSAGREMRVIVDNKKTTDRGALELSRQITEKIEKECSYPGLIKVTVVRHSEKIAVA